MMKSTYKKKIAVFSTCWSGEILYKYVNGIRAGLKEANADLYLFLSHAVFGPDEAFLSGEMNIYNLPDMKEFDAAIIFANGLDFPELLDNLNKRCIDAGIPVVYTGKDDERFYYIGSDNYVGTRSMMEHMLHEHHTQKVWFIAGTQDNMDSNIRMQAITDVLREHNLDLSPDDVCYTNWSPYTGYAFVINRVKAGVPLPDAIMCANDTLAVVICAELRKNGYTVPKDVLVTGFDNDFLAQVYDPSISSVDQRFDNIGQKTAELLSDIFQGKKVKRTQKVTCEFVPSESCGCTSAKDFTAIRRRIGRDKYEEKIHNSNFDMRLSTIEGILLQGRAYSDLNGNLTALNALNTHYEGATFHVAIDPLFEKTIHDQQHPLLEKGYPEFMDMVYSKDKGYATNYPHFETRQLVPQENPQDGNRIYIFLPLHESKYSYGYIVFGDDLEKLNNTNHLRKYIERFNLILSKFYQNLRLDALNQKLLQMTETDVLTHVKNRTAFETRLGDLQHKMQFADKPSFAFAVFDVNNLKRINDTLGHEAGDNYIVNSCRMICKTFKKSAVYRIGGDEFVVVMENDDYENREILLKSLKEEMAELATKDLPIYEKISIASGMAVYNPESDFHISEVFSRADAAMYENKASMKKELV